LLTLASRNYLKLVFKDHQLDINKIRKLKNTNLTCYSGFLINDEWMQANIFVLSN